MKAKQGFQMTGMPFVIGIQERDEGRAGGPDSVIPRGGNAAVGLTDQADAGVTKGRRLFGTVIRGTVIHDQDFNIL
jgi:hypothetical protein